MFKTSAILIAGALTLLAASTLRAESKVEYRYESGLCDDGKSQWYSVAMYQDGDLVWIDGQYCNGVHYHRWKCGDNIVGDDPTSGFIPTHSGTCDGGGEWRSVVTYDNQGTPVSAVWFDCQGQGHTSTCGTAGQ
ncbi:MAG TPA: hypothetical protein VHI13_14255 [Candidatus Kapabacteria bacterium]|nr:hypothetical protein [Candidatus Kapabacteria bacterium]